MPNQAEPYYQLGLAYLAAGNPQMAANNLLKAAELDPKHLGTQVKLAEMMAVNKDLKVVKEAEKRAKDALALSPENADALQALALAELRLDEREDARTHLTQALQKFPQHLKSSMVLAMLLLGDGDHAGAEAVLKKAVEQAPQSVEPALAFARFYLFTRKNEEAEKWLRRAIELDPKQPAPLLDLGALLVRTNRLDQAEAIYRQLAAFPQTEYKPVHALFLFRTGKRDAAIAELEKLSQQDRKDRAARTRLVAAYLATQRASDAERVLNAALKDSPRDADALLQRAEIMLGTGRLAEADRDLKEVLRVQPDSAQAHYVMSRVHFARRSPANQRQELTDALRIDPKMLVARLELARLLTTANDAKAALAIVEQTPAEQKQVLPVIVERNAALLALGQWDELRKGVDEGFKVGQSTDLLLQDGLIKIHKKDIAGAKLVLERALKQSPEDLRVLQALTLTYPAQRPDDALKRIREHATQFPKSAPVQSFLGKYLAQLKRVGEARTAFVAASSVNPNFEPALLALAEIDVYEGKLDSARQTVSGILVKNPLSIEARLALARVEQRAGNHPAMIAQYRKVLEDDASNIEALNNLAYALANEGNQPDEALKLAQQVKEILPNSPSIDDTIGWAFYKKGHYSTAVGHLERAAAKDPRPVIQYHLAMACFRTGNRKRGDEVLRAAMNAAPNLPEAKMAAEARRIAQP
jgi:tetratricopeptide (TPR) repeat protein